MGAQGSVDEALAREKVGRVASAAKEHLHRSHSHTSRRPALTGKCAIYYDLFCLKKSRAARTHPYAKNQGRGAQHAVLHLGLSRPSPFSREAALLKRSGPRAGRDTLVQGSFRETCHTTHQALIRSSPLQRAQHRFISRSCLAPMCGTKVRAPILAAREHAHTIMQPPLQASSARQRTRDSSTCCCCRPPRQATNALSFLDVLLLKPRETREKLAYKSPAATEGAIRPGAVTIGRSAASIQYVGVVLDDITMLRRVGVT